MTHLLNKHRFLLTILFLAFWTPAAWAVSTDRAGNLFSGDEDIVLRTAVPSPARWALTNDYGERIEGSAPVVDGRVRISTCGLRYGRYTFAIEGDGEIVGGVVPPLVQIHPDLTAVIFAPFRLHWNNPEEALMWRQLGAWELRFEYRFDGMNPAKGEFRYDPAIDRYMQALADHGIRPSFKINGAPKWNDSSAVPRKWGEPISYEDYEETVRRYARHYGRFGIERYYIINEPEAAGWWSSGWDGYYRFLHSSYKTLKEVDPRILVIAPNSWSFRPEFLDPVLRSGDVDIVSGHYTVEKIIGNVHGYFYLTRMRKTGVILPFINAEDFSRWRSNLDMPAMQKNYPGITPYSSVWGAGPVVMATLDTGCYRVVELHLMMQREPGPFAKWEAGDIIPDQLCFQHRTASDEFAGVQYRRRLDGVPPSVLAWLYRRGSDNFLGAYVPVGELTQLMEISTSSKRLRIVDAFGNEQTAEPIAGKVRLLLTNAEVYVHGLGSDDKFTFLPRLENERPQIIDPGKPSGAVGVPFRLRLDGRDSDANLVRKLLPEWRLVKAPEGMTIRPGSGLIEWVPEKAGRVDVTVRLVDADGGASERTFPIEVKSADSPLPPYFVSRPAPVAVRGGQYRYTPVANDPRGGEVTYAVEGPAGMKLEDSQLKWQPSELGVYRVKVSAATPEGAEAAQQFELAVCPNPDRPDEGMSPPRAPTDLTVVRSGPKGVTLVWNPHSFAEHVIQRAPSRSGPWREIATTKDNWYNDSPTSEGAYYRVLARHGGGASELTAAVNGRNRAPVADAGKSIKLDVPGPAALDGTRSFDPEGKALRYRWTVVNAPHGSHPMLAGAASAQPALKVDRPGRYTVGLTVSDGEETSAPDYAWLIVGADPMERVAYAGPDRFATVGETVHLQPAAASPARGLAKWFWRWDHSPLDGYVGIQNSLKESASLTAEIPGVYQIVLWPLDDKTYGYPDVLRVIAGPAVPAR